MQSDLISKRALIKFIDKGVAPELLLHNNASGDGVMAALSKVLEDTDVIPTIDAVPVVRCRECVCSSLCDDQLFCSRIANVMDGYYRGTAEVVKPDDYCSHGIRQTAKPLDGGAE